MPIETSKAERERREDSVHFRVTREERARIAAGAKQRLISVSDFARESTLNVTAEVRMDAVSTRGDLKALADRLLHIEFEFQQVIRHINRLGDIMESAQLLSAASVASSAYLRVGPDDSDEHAKVVVKEHLQVAQDNAGAIVSFFNNR